MKPTISIVLGSFNRIRHLKKLIASIRHNEIKVPFEVIVIDGGSIDGSVRWLTKQKDIITIVQHNQGTWQGKPLERFSWGYFMNIAFKAAHGKYIVLISDDNLLVPEAVMNGFTMFEGLLKEGRKIGALAFYWRNWPGMDDYWVGQTFGKIFVSFGMFLKDAVQEIGWIDEDSYQFYCADLDLSLRLWQAGFEILDCKHAFVEHQPKPNPFRKSSDDQTVFVNKWVNELALENKGEYLADLGKERSWIRLDSEDPTHTVKMFPIDWNLKRFYFRIKRKLRKIVPFLFKSKNKK